MPPAQKTQHQRYRLTKESVERNKDFAGTGPSRITPYTWGLECLAISGEIEMMRLEPRINCHQTCLTFSNKPCPVPPGFWPFYYTAMWSAPSGATWIHTMTSGTLNHEATQPLLAWVEMTQEHPHPAFLLIHLCTTQVSPSIPQHKYCIRCTKLLPWGKRQLHSLPFLCVSLKQRR